MTKDTSIRIQRIYSIVLSISIIITGICLILGCLVIYFTGERIYSREIVAQVFSKISVPVYITIALTIINLFIPELTQSNYKNQKKSTASPQILKLMYSKKNINACDETIKCAVLREKRIRRVNSIVRFAIITACSILFLIYALDPANYHQSEINSSMIRAMCVLIPCLAISFGYSVYSVYSDEKSIKREIELLKQIPSAESIKAEAVAGNPITLISIARLAILVAAIAVLIYGFVSGGTADVLTKAINICTECIGLG